MSLPSRFRHGEGIKGAEIKTEEGSSVLGKWGWLGKEKTLELVFRDNWGCPALSGENLPRKRARSQPRTKVILCWETSNSLCRLCNELCPGKQWSTTLPTYFGGNPHLNAGNCPSATSSYFWKHGLEFHELSLNMPNVVCSKLWVTRNLAIVSFNRLRNVFLK